MTIPNRPKRRPNHPLNGFNCSSGWRRRNIRFVVGEFCSPSGLTNGRKRGPPPATANRSASANTRFESLTPRPHGPSTTTTGPLPNAPSTAARHPLDGPVAGPHRWSADLLSRFECVTFGTSLVQTPDDAAESDQGEPAQLRETEAESIDLFACPIFKHKPGATKKLCARAGWPTVARVK